MKILNLGSGTKTCDSVDVINIDWSMYLRLKQNKILRRIAPLILSGERWEKFKILPENVVVHNLAKGIPFESNSVDVVYNSHLLEHLDREVAKMFLLEVKRVLKPGGIHRIVVPDLEVICKAYISHILDCDINKSEYENHDLFIASLLEQSVRKEAFGTSQQTSLRRIIENFILGDARQRGETHQWMYDRINIKTILLNLGYKEVYIQKYNTSVIPNFNNYGLDIDENGNQYKRESLYVEAVK